MNKKIVFGLLISLSLITLCGCNKKETKKEEKNIDVVEEKNEVDFEFTNISLTLEDGNIIIVTDVTNKTSEDTTLTGYTEIVKDDVDNIITEIPVDFNNVIKAKETKRITNTVDLDLPTATKVEYEAK